MPFWPEPVSAFGSLKMTMPIQQFTYVGHIIQPDPPTTLTLAVQENPSQSVPCQNRRRYVVSAAFDPAVTSHADADRLLRTEPQVQLTILLC